MFLKKKKKKSQFPEQISQQISENNFLPSFKNSKNRTGILLSHQLSLYNFSFALLHCNCVKVYRQSPQCVFTHCLQGFCVMEFSASENTGSMLPSNVDESHTMCWLILGVIMRVPEVRVRNTLSLPDLLGSAHQFCQRRRQLSAQVQP